MSAGGINTVSALLKIGVKLQYPGLSDYRRRYRSGSRQGRGEQKLGCDSQGEGRTNQCGVSFTHC